MAKRGRRTDSSEERVVRTVRKDCHVACGMLAHVKDDRLVKVEGDLYHPVNSSPICLLFALASPH